MLATSAPRLLVALTLLCAPAAVAQTVPAQAEPPRDVRTPAAVAAAATVVPVALGVTLLFIKDDGLDHVEGGLAAAGLLLGPSVGSLMLGDPGRAAIGAGIRAGASAALVTSVGYRFAAGWGGSEEEVFLTNTLVGLSAGMLAFGVAYNFATLPASARAGAPRMEAGVRWDGASGRVVPGIRVGF